MFTSRPILRRSMKSMSSRSVGNFCHAYDTWSITDNVKQQELMTTVIRLLDIASNCLRSPDVDLGFAKVSFDRQPMCFYVLSIDNQLTS